jgi:hypothetical protein
MIRSARANLWLLTSRNYLLAGLGCTGLLAFITVMLNVGEAEATVDERGPSARRRPWGNWRRRVALPWHWAAPSRSSASC